DARRVPLDRLLIGLSIPHVGGETAFLIAKYFKTLPRIAAASEEALIRTSGIGPIIGRSVAAWFKDKNNRALIARLEKHVTIRPVVAAEKGPLAGQTVVITGTLSTLSREEAAALVRRAGGKSAAAVSSKTSFVVAGEAAGAKLAQAKQLGIPVIGEPEFLKKLRP
ncbi:NAD-dependent DNA ligase LigA, partial [Patescibacteria group bacterium]|nr:NAD-dependent DNA ligase LigA [Patescibacteria group bacterium]